MPRDLKLNSLSRYSKLSPHVALEEYGHCEIPAGCGGVVLRWRDRGCGARVPLRMYSCGVAEIFLDGNRQHSGLVFFPLGEHVLSFVIEKAGPGRLVLMALAADSNRQYPDLLGFPATSDDGTWRYSLSPPPEPDWWYPEFDDSGWPSLVRDERLVRGGQGTGADDYWRQLVDELREAGAIGLGLPHAQPAGKQILASLLGALRPVASGGERIWIRKRFTLERQKPRSGV